MNFDRETKAKKWRKKIIFQTNGAGTTGHLYAK